MPAYSDIEHVFRQVLSGSKTFGGRFQIMPNWGSELNSNTLGALLDETLKESKPQFPMVAMMPPRSRAEYHGDSSDVVDITLLFLTTTYYEGTSIKDLHRPTNTSKRTIVQDWDQMRDAAIDFMAALEALRDYGQLTTMLLASGIQAMQPFSTISTKRLSGVMLQFSVVVPLPVCAALNDYPDLQNLNLAL